MADARHITRRAAIVGAAASTAALTIPVATAAAEHPWVRARRLAKELSQVLAEIRDSEDCMSSLCVAVVHPAGAPYSTGFADRDLYDEGWAIARQHVASRDGWRA